MSGLWYPVTPEHPAPIVRVWGLVGPARLRLLVSRGQRPHTAMWASWDAGRADPLPDPPYAWQPQQPSKWRASLPDPIDIRDASIASGASTKSDQWWRDAHAVAYEPLGGISMDMAEARVLRAAAACGQGVASPYARTFSSVLADLARDTHSGEAVCDYVPPFRQLPQDIGDFETAMAWFAALNPPDLRHTHADAWGLNRAQMVIVLRSLRMPYSFGRIGEKWRISADGARKVYLRAIDAVHRAANGLQPYAWVSTVDQMAALRERNRQARGAA